MTDYKALYQEIHPRYLELSELGDHEIKRLTPSMGEFKIFTVAPEAKAVLEKLESLISKLKDIKEAQDNELKQVVDELQGEITRHELELRQLDEALSENISGVKAKLESVRALEPEELKSCARAHMIGTAIPIIFIIMIQYVLLVGWIKKKIDVL